MVTATTIADSRERLLNAARELIWRNSYATVSVDDLCRRAVVNKGSFYHHFPSKAELAQTAYEEMWTAMRPTLDACFSPLNPPLERLAAYCAATIEHQGVKQAEFGCVVGCPFTNLGVEVGTQDDALRRLTALTAERIQVCFSAAIRDAQAKGEIPAGDAQQLASQIHSLILGAAAQARITNDLAAFAGLATGVRRLLGAP